MKKGLAILLALIMVFSISSLAFADPDVDPIVTITSNSGVYIVQQGETLDLTATSVMAQNAQDWRLISHSWTGATMVIGGNVVGDELYRTSPPTALQFVSYAQFSAVGKDVGYYDVVYEIRVMRIAGSQYGDGSDEVSIEVINGTIPVYVDCPAAPAVAASILKNYGITHRYDTGDVDGRGRAIWGNYISAVAHKMGSSVGDQNGSWFMGLDKCDGEEPNEDYYWAIYDYLMELGADLP